MKICNCKTDLLAYLCDIPLEWREGIVDAICYILGYDTDCSDCNTLTFLSAITINGNEVSINYTDELGVVFSRKFNLYDVLNTAVDVDANCVSGDWDTLTSQLQSFVDSHCDCCEITTTTTSTTTTTTNPCDCHTYAIVNNSGSFQQLFYKSCTPPYLQDVVNIEDDGTEYICACEEPVSEVLEITEIEEGCDIPATTTTSTTTTSTSTTSTTSTTTTTTIAPTTTTTTSTSTTTTTTSGETTTTTTTSTSTTTTTTMFAENNIRVENNSLDIIITAFELDGVTVPDGPYATTGNVTQHTLGTDGLVDVFIQWNSSVTGQNIIVGDTYGVTQHCENITVPDVTPFFTVPNVDMTGPLQLTVTLADGVCT